jgi:hypothetical protein
MPFVRIMLPSLLAFDGRLSWTTASWPRLAPPAGRTRALTRCPRPDDAPVPTNAIAFVLSELGAVYRNDQLPEPGCRRRAKPQKSHAALQTFVTETSQTAGSL